MAFKSNYDIIIGGAGASGLSLLWYILQSDALKEKRILIADRSLSPATDKTWCFWDDADMPFSTLIHHTWHTLEVGAFGNRYVDQLGRFRYHCMRSVDYSRRILALAKEDPRVDLLESDIHSFHEIDEQTSGMVTANGKFTAPFIFQSALKPPGLEDKKLDISLKQHFLGWEIKAERPLFDPGRAVLMDFDVPQKNGVTFVYVLPFSETEALIEYTLFSAELLTDKEYETGIRGYMTDRYGLNDSGYEITRVEKGVIPMEDRRYPPYYCNRVLNTGTVGGLTKPSTGYTFTRIHRQSSEIVQALENNLPLPDKSGSDYRFRVYDLMLLWLLHNHPKTSVRIFSELFRKNSFDRILTFLEEKTHPGQEVSIFSSLPYIPFFKSIWKMKHRIVTGA